MGVERILSKSLQETIDIGARFAARLMPGNMVLLYGDLGVGKTEFVKSICDVFNVRQIITSPTFTIVNQYDGTRLGKPVSILHIDLYRIQNKNELMEMGFEDYIYSDTIKFVEWAERSFGFISKYDYRISIEADPEDECTRHIEIEQA